MICAVRNYLPPPNVFSNLATVQSFHLIRFFISYAIAVRKLRNGSSFGQKFLMFQHILSLKISVRELHKNHRNENNS